MMTNTRDKLNEAKHFLDEMKRVSSDPAKFRYELTAFLAASRSITLIMQKEFSERSGFADWYTQIQGEMEKNGILKYLHRQRNISHHERPILQYPIGITEQNTTSLGMNVVLAGTGSSINLSSNFAVTPTRLPVSKIVYHFDDMLDGGKDVITVCQEAINALEFIVDKCEEKFLGE